MSAPHEDLTESLAAQRMHTHIVSVDEPNGDSRVTSRAYGVKLRTRDLDPTLPEDCPVAARKYAKERHRKRWHQDQRRDLSYSAVIAWLESQVGARWSDVQKSLFSRCKQVNWVRGKNVLYHNIVDQLENGGTVVGTGIYVDERGILRVEQVTKPVKEEKEKAKKRSTVPQGPWKHLVDIAPWTSIVQLKTPEMHWLLGELPRRYYIYQHDGRYWWAYGHCMDFPSEQVEVSGHVYHVTWNNSFDVTRQLTGPEVFFFLRLPRSIRQQVMIGQLSTIIKNQRKRCAKYDVTRPRIIRMYRNNIDLDSLRF